MLSNLSPGNKSVLVFGGARSGKSSFALQLAENSGRAPLMVATAQVEDDEMRERVSLHKEERGPHWGLIEEPLDLVGVLQRETNVKRIVLVDCLTLWLSNLMFAERDIAGACAELAGAIPTLNGPVIFVSNELGLGTVPDHALTRKFRDAQGRLNQIIAKACSDVIVMQAGLPRPLKPAPALTLEF